MKKTINYVKGIILYFISDILSIIGLITISLFNKRKGEKVIFGADPIINNKYWSNALKDIGIKSETFMSGYSIINTKDDYDIYFEDVIPNFFKTNRILKKYSHDFFVWLYIIKNAKTFIMPFRGIVFQRFFWKIEYLLFKINNIKIIILPYGSDMHMYSKIQDPSVRNVLLISYPEYVKTEKLIESKVFFWSKYADIVIAGFAATNGLPRWDITIAQYIHIDTREWKAKKHYSDKNGINGIVKIMHTPNHRGFKGTEFLLQAVKELKEEGLQIELVLLEKVQNSKVKELMQEVDILAEQFITIGYALSGMEGMASGLPVLANLSNPNVIQRFRRYSFLNECPILSTTPETIKDNLKVLITDPNLRKELGQLGRKYAEKYHSYKTTHHMFTNIFDKLEGKDIDLMNLYHPLKSDYVKTDYIDTPLHNNKISKKEL